MVKQAVYIKDAMHQKNPTVTGFVSEVGQITQDINKGGEPYTRQTITLKDHSGEINVILWNDECDKMRLNQYYTIENGWIKEYEGNAQLHIGKFGKMVEADLSDMLPIPGSNTNLDMNRPSTSDGIDPINASSTINQDIDVDAAQKVAPDNQIDTEIQTATKVMKAFIKACKEEGAEGATLNAASVYNTVLMRRGK